jgi:hypothetical protein
MLCPPLLVVRVVKNHWKLQKTKLNIEHEEQSGPQNHLDLKNDHAILTQRMESKTSHIWSARIKARERVRGKRLKQFVFGEHGSTGKRAIFPVSELTSTLLEYVGQGSQAALMNINLSIGL